ncbi:MAG: nucleotidyltransferase domain-containing protein [Alphaproteobacteria bacterium]
MSHALFMPHSCRAARALLELSQEELARRAGVARATVVEFEKGARTPIRANRRALYAVLEAGGVAFLPGGAVLRDSSGDAAGVRNGERQLAAVLHILQANRARLRRSGVRHLSLFGSTARGEAAPGSDVDILVELDGRKRLDVFDYAGIAGEIQKLLPMRADVALRDRLNARLTPEVLRDEIRVF